MQKTLSVINLTAIRRNALFLKGLARGGRFYAVVKADAYGHGAERVCAEIEDIADGFCVAITDEGAALRISGVSKPILVFTPPLDAADAAVMHHYGLTATVDSVKTASLSCGLACHIKVNTGMNRYGCGAREVADILKILNEGQVQGVYTHFYKAEDAAVCERQLAAFAPAERLVKAFNPAAFSHVSASGGLLRGGKFLKDGVRCGIALYGYAPEGFSCPRLTPALKVYARKVRTAETIGDGAGYGEMTENYPRLSTYRLGYADGFARTAPLGEGKLCMDAFISPRDDDKLCVFDDADAYAKRLGTISYEVLCSVTRRSERVYER